MLPILYEVSKTNLTRAYEFNGYFKIIFTNIKE